jgi:hypothetical protein
MYLNNSKNNIYSKNIVKTITNVNQGEAPSQETSVIVPNLKNNKIFPNLPQSHTAETYSKKNSSFSTPITSKYSS